MTNAAPPALYDYATAEYIRPATTDELAASVAAAEHDGGVGVILVDDQGNRRCYVEYPTRSPKPRHESRRLSSTGSTKLCGPSSTTTAPSAT